MTERALFEGKSLPWLIEADGGAVGDWAAANRERVRRRVDEHGAVLIRGLGVAQPEQIERFAGALGTEAMDYIGGASPRDRIAGKVYESTYMDRRLPLPIHHELSYLNVVPATLYFACQTPPGAGGRTPIADMAAVYDALDPAVRDRFEQRGIAFTHTLGARRSRTSMKTWMDMFETDDRDEAQRRAEQVGYAVRWLDDGAMKLIRHCRAVLRHPRTGRKVWFNQAHLFHSTWSWELTRIGRKGLARIVRFIEWTGRKRADLNTQRVQSMFGDDTPIDRDAMIHVRQTIWDHAAQFDWQAGDLLVLDNLWIAHGRNPYTPPRKILLTMTDPTELANLDESAAA